MKCSSIQKDIVRATAVEVEKAIAKEIGNEFFAILVDESRDVSCKEQMSLVLRFVNNEGVVVERFIGIKQVSDTSALSLKSAIYSMLLGQGLSPCSIRGQGYDGASNMSGAFNGLKTLIMKESQSAHFIHCFAHQLQLALVFVAKNHCSINDFFERISRLLNMIGSSYKRRDLLRKKQATHIVEALAKEFPKHELGFLRGQLMNYINDVRGDERFSDLKGIGHLAKMMVETNKSIIYPKVYLLLKLALILPVATSTVERAFSTMKLIKNDLRNKSGDQFMNDCLLSYIEKEVLDDISNEAIMDEFYRMKPRRQM
ncbi:uncharacterized protein [Rutidosis leptorrhynchoides]|uniref:uncharacterized protein n=1 Tax=Rutidosis leptorrhynchoides TaxID=125765 RepID=UPI003A98D57D